MPMLEEALKVVEAARAMRLVERGGMSVSELGRDALAEAVCGLRAALEDFDREAGGSDDADMELAPPPALSARPSFHAPPQIDDEGFMVLHGEDPGPEAEPPAGKPSGEPEVRKHETAESPAPAAPAAAPARRESSPAAVRKAAAQEPRASRHGDVNDGTFFDGGESAADLLRAIDAIDSKLAFAVAKVGWTPRLRSLAAAKRIARENMYIDVEGDNTFVRMPGHVWGTLSVAIAQVAMDQDLKVEFPEPGPRRPEPEYAHAPRPPADQ